MLKDLNKDMFTDRSKEEDAWKEATGQEMSFEEYLKKDKAFQKESQTPSNPNEYQKRSAGAHA